MRTMPYFMENKDWYYSVPDKKCPWLEKNYLTELGKSIPEVVKSYEDWYNPQMPDEFWESTKKESIADIYKRGIKDGKTENEIMKEVQAFLEISPAQFHIDF